MTQQNPLDLKGSFLQHPFPELLVEIEEARLDGSLRLSLNDKKTIVYLEKGQVVFSVSNSKNLRFFSVMLDQKRVDKQTLAKHPSFANDLEFAASLRKSGEFSKADVDEMIKAQVAAIVTDVLSWPEGEWHFNPLARVRGDIRYQTDLQKPLLDQARLVPNDTVVNRLKRPDEAFCLKGSPADHLLQSHELHVLGLFGDQPLSVGEIRQRTTMPNAGLLQALYVLWLGRFLHRVEWFAAFVPTKIEEIQTAKIHRVKAAVDLVAAKAEDPAAESVVSTAKPKAAKITLSLKEFLERVESSETHYDTLGLSKNAEVSEIKQTYFGLAKLFHPDKFHREAPDMQKRVQAAFTELAHAYETLKNDESRDSYDYKMRKEIEVREKRRVAGQAEPEAADIRTESALEAFEQGLNFLNEEEFDQAAVLLGRAVHYSPDNAQFHAYYGQALSFFDTQVHKAEAEFQAAVRLDPKNVKIRMMLIDFFIDMNMTKRAIGELNRFLELVPGNRDATSRLERLQK